MKAAAFGAIAAAVLVIVVITAAILFSFKNLQEPFIMAVAALIGITLKLLLEM